MDSSRHLRLAHSALLTALLGIGFASFTGDAAAVGTRRFILENADDFKGGDLKGVAVDASGRVHAGLNLGAHPITEVPTIWSALQTKDALLLGTGNDGKLLSFKDGKVTTVAETKALVVTSLTEAWGGAVILGTMPDGKVMKWAGGKLTDLVALKGTEHVWQVAYDKKSNAVFAATGPEGKVYRITQEGNAQVYFDAEEQHIVSLAVASDGTLYAGASDKAKLYKVTGPGRATVFYDFGRTEVRGVAIGSKGEIYAIANDIKASSYAPSRKGRGGGSAAAGPTSTPSKTRGKGTLYRFATDGSPEQLLDEPEEHYTSLVVGDDGRPYVGTGAEGRIYTVDEFHDSMLIGDVDERTIGALVMSGKQKYVLASDPAVVHPVRAPGPEAVWTSKVLDAGLRARFGRMTWDANGTVELSTRTGNTKDPDDSWSDWSKPIAAAAEVTSPPARYVQIRARFSRDANAVLSEVTLPFVTDNLRAVLTEIDASSGAKKSKKSGGSDASPEGVSASGGPIDKKPETSVSITWKVDNPDKDELRYRVQYKLVGTTNWYDMLKPGEKLNKETYSWDTSDLPEGNYRVRVIATDEFANPPDKVTRSEMESSVVLVDNTPPSIENVRVNGRRIQATIIDGVGPIQRLEISVSGTDEWFPFFPADGVFDEQREEIDADVTPFAPKGTALLAIRAYDKANNSVIKNVTVK